jgi:hypothetical protein
MATAAKTYDRQTATFLAVVGQNMPELSGDVMQGWIENPKALQKTLRIVLYPRETTVTVPGEFATWKTITIGTQKLVKDLTKALSSNGFRISDWTGDVLKKITLAGAETEIELVLVLVADLGFTEATRRDAIYDRAKELGLDLAPAEVGPQLRLAYEYQPRGEWMLMAMDPITDSAGDPWVFLVGRGDDGPGLHSRRGDPDGLWNPDSRWVFARRKQN